MKDAATPQRVTTDFVNAVLQMKGGNGAAIPPFLKKMGFLNSDGTPTPLYDRFRNDGTSKAAVAEALRFGFKPLFQANEYAYKLNDNDLKGLIVQVTGLEKDNRVAQAIFGTFKKLLSHASFDVTGAADLSSDDQSVTSSPRPDVQRRPDAREIALSYTINLNLPATTNPEVFNAIFKSLREQLLNE